MIKTHCFQSKFFQIGIELAEELVRIVIVSGTTPNIKIDDLLLMPYKENDAKLISEAFAAIRKKISRKHRNIILGIDYRKTIAKEMSFEEKLSDLEIMKMIKHNSEAWFGQNSTKLYFDFERLLSSDKNCSGEKIKIIATCRNYLSALVAAGLHYGFKFKSIDLNTAALNRACIFHKFFDEAQCTALVVLEKNLLFLVRQGYEVIYLKQDEINQNLIDDSYDAILARPLQRYHATNNVSIQKIILLDNRKNISYSTLECKKMYGIDFEVISEDHLPVPVAYFSAYGLSLWGVL